MSKDYLFISTIIALICSACATYTPQYKNNQFDYKTKGKTVERSFYLIGDAGNAKKDNLTEGLELLKKTLDTVTTANNYVLFLGDNIYPSGMPKSKHEEREIAEGRIEAQLQAIKNFNGEVLFIPGNHDWYSNGVKGLKREEEYIRKQIDKKNIFLPSKGCPLESIAVSDDIQLLVIDSQWYLANWDKNPTMNDDCEIKTREKLFLEIEGEFKKNTEKTVLVALHHPLITYGPHGGKFSAGKHLFPLKEKIPMPVLGTLVAQIRAQGGVSPQDISNEHYNAFIKRLSTMARSNKKVIFVSGHEHSLQYNIDNGLHQIISGSGSKKSAVALGAYGKFAYPDQGFAVVDVFTDGSSQVRFYGSKEGKASLVYSSEIYAKDEYEQKNYDVTKEKYVISSVYNKEKTEKSKGYKKIWGNHYRTVYGTDLKVPVATLDTLMGGVSIDRKGGGHQTRSLRLLDKDGRRYSLRAVKKSATQFLQKAAFKNTYLEDNFNETFTEDLLLDFYTSSHPFATFAVGTMADAIGVYHANPQLLYIPKHNALGKYNAEFGDELYILEERPGKEFTDVASFGKPDDIESTDDMIKKLRKNEKYAIDEKAYIKARLFDMILGDWDRHSDQWRWARFEKDDKEYYRPIPRDRDQVFSNYDGKLIDVIKFLIPLTRKFQEYDAELKNVRWINESGIRLDRAFTSGSNKEVWKKQAAYIHEYLNDETIDKAFDEIPNEVQNETLEQIKKYLKARRDHIEEIAERYYDYMAKQVIIRGTDKDDFFEIIREDNKTIIKISRIKNGKIESPFYQRTINAGETKEIWVYGLDDDDKFKVSGKGKNTIRVRIIGGQDQDEYLIEDGKKIKIYDHKNQDNIVKEKNGANVVFTNRYNYNTYDYNKYISKTNTIIPFVGFNPDDGFNVNITDTYVIKGFKNSPFQSRHKIRGAFYFATEGFDLSYQGEFADVFGNWNLQAEALYTSHNFTQNFFGFGNSTINLDDEKGLDYNRVKTSIISGALGITKNGYYGDRITIKAMLEGIEIDATEDRFLTTDPVFSSTIRDDFFERMYFGGLELTYGYESFDNRVNPTRGMTFHVKTETKVNVENTHQAYGYLNPHLGFYNALTRNKKLVLKTDVDAQILVGDDYEFYQAARLGGDNGLRGFREQRFAGRSAVVFNADLRYSFNKFKTGLLPLQFGVYGGYDYGRVWLDDEDSNQWHDSVGGGFWINAVDAVSGQLGIFNSDEGTRVSFGFGVDF
ncbi:BamA/TamA family outer membrane protein [Aquimarina rhabdastrellae]